MENPEGWLKKDCLLKSTPLENSPSNSNVLALQDYQERAFFKVSTNEKKLGCSTSRHPSENPAWKDSCQGSYVNTEIRPLLQQKIKTVGGTLETKISNRFAQSSSWRCWKVIRLKISGTKNYKWPWYGEPIKLWLLMIPSCPPVTNKPEAVRKQTAVAPPVERQQNWSWNKGKAI